LGEWFRPPLGAFPGNSSRVGTPGVTSPAREGNLRIFSCQKILGHKSKPREINRNLETEPTKVPWLANQWEKTKVPERKLETGQP